MANNIQSTTNNMTDALNGIIRRWRLGNLFLSAYLGRSVDTIKSYRCGRRVVPQEMGERMRRLHEFLKSWG